MQIKTIKFHNSVTIAGTPETFFKSDSAALRGTKVSVEGPFLRFDPIGKDSTLVPLANVNCITISNDQNAGDKDTLKSETPANGRAKK
jgi:hypothetical protein